MEEKKEQKQLSIELPDDVAEGVYSNLAIIAHSNMEFILDFVRMMPNMPKAKVKSRVVISPEHAKRFAKALLDNIQKYEAQYGPIKENKGPQIPPMSFNTPTAQA